MHFNTNQLAKYESYSYIEFTIKNEQLANMLRPYSNKEYGNIEISVDGSMICGTFEYDECISIDDSSIRVILLSILEVCANHWISTQFDKDLYLMIQCINDFDICLENSSSYFYLLDKEIVVDGPGSMIKEYILKDQMLTCTIKESYEA